MLRKINLLNLFVVPLFFVNSYGQNRLGTDELFCRIINKDTEEAVFYATVKLAGTNRGLIADDKGEFRLPINLYLSDTLVISAIGYKNKKLSINTLSENEVNLIYLEPSIEKLDEVKLISEKNEPLTAKQIVMKAITNISRNYPRTPSSYIAYYRDYQQPIDSIYAMLSNQNAAVEYINLNEGIVEVFDAGFDTDQLLDKKNQTLLYTYHPNMDFTRDSILSIPYDNYKDKYLKNTVIPPLGGNELNLLQLTNAIRNHNKFSFSFVDIFKKDFIKNHKFSLEGINYLNEVSIYKINFSTKYSIIGDPHFAEGTIFISKKNYAIHKFDYEVYYSTKRNLLYAIAIEYARIKEKMYLNYITFNNRFQVNSNNYFDVEEAVYDEKENVVIIYFNRDLNQNLVKGYRKKIRLAYKNRKIKIEKVVVSKDYIKAYLDKQQMSSLSNFDLSNFVTNLQLMIKGIKDTQGNKIREMPKLFLNQYREIFVQEVFPGKKIVEDAKPMNKSLPMFKSEVNIFDKATSYWENTPLKQEKTIN